MQSSVVAVTVVKRLLNEWNCNEFRLVCFVHICVSICLFRVYHLWQTLVSLQWNIWCVKLRCCFCGLPTRLQLSNSGIAFYWINSHTHSSQLFNYDLPLFFTEMDTRLLLVLSRRRTDAFHFHCNKILLPSYRIYLNYLFQ